MGAIKINGSTSGSTTITAPATGSDETIELSTALASKQADVMTTKGDLAAYGTAVDRLAVGTNGQVLTADSGETLGVKWADASGGLTLLSSEDFSAVSSISVDNIFSATYRNYRMMLFFQSSSQTSLTMRFRASSSDDSGTNYQYQQFESQSTTNTGARSTSATSADLGGTSSTSGSHCTVDLFQPNRTTRTGYNSSAYLPISGAYYRATVGQTTVSTAYDGLTIITGSGTMTGFMRIYGYRD